MHAAAEGPDGSGAVARARSNEAFEEGLAVWARVGGCPWWPARVVSRGTAEEALEGTLGGGGGVVVWFFHDDDSIAVVGHADIVEYTFGMAHVYLPDELVDSCRTQLLAACAEANKWIGEHGCEEQRDKLSHARHVVDVAAQLRPRYPDGPWQTKWFLRNRPLAPQPRIGATSP